GRRRATSRCRFRRCGRATPRDGSAPRSPRPPARAHSPPPSAHVRLPPSPARCNSCSMQATAEQVADAVLRASRVLVSVAARSLAGVDHDVPLPQYRALVVLASRGPQRPTELAEALAVHPSTVTRLCDRLV